mmetsp:Transcript_34631/g.90384  ORF Transcript_34631/g.90384 Transcript_34631/m.90384 type:complete len:204 (+) Transcript_34631:449-1060(+)
MVRYSASVSKALGAISRQAAVGQDRLKASSTSLSSSLMWMNVFFTRGMFAPHAPKIVRSAGDAAPRADESGDWDGTDCTTSTAAASNLFSNPIEPLSDWAGVFGDTGVDASGTICNDRRSDGATGVDETVCIAVGQDLAKFGVPSPSSSESLSLKCKKVFCWTMFTAAVGSAVSGTVAGKGWGTCTCAAVYISGSGTKHICCT